MLILNMQYCDFGDIEVKALFIGIFIHAKREPGVWKATSECNVPSATIFYSGQVWFTSR